MCVNYFLTVTHSTVQALLYIPVVQHSAVVISGSHCPSTDQLQTFSFKLALQCIVINLILRNKNVAY